MCHQGASSTHATVELHSDGFTWADLIVSAANIPEGHDLNLAKAPEPAPGTPIPEPGAAREDLKVLVNAVRYNPGYQMRPTGKYYFPYPAEGQAAARNPYLIISRGLGVSKWFASQHPTFQVLRAG